MVDERPELYTTTTVYRTTAASQASGRTYTSASYTGGTSPGVVVVEQGPYFETSTVYRESISQTTTYVSRPYTGGPQSGLYIVEAPLSYTTTTSYYDATASSQTGESTTTIAQASGTNPGTVQVVRPRSYTTVYSYGTSVSSSTSTIATFAGSAPGTVRLVSSFDEHS